MRKSGVLQHKSGNISETCLSVYLQGLLTNQCSFFSIILCKKFFSSSFVFLLTVVNVTVSGFYF